MSKTTKTVRDQTIIEALGDQLKAAAAITLDGEVYKPKDLQQQFQGEVDAMKATQSARTALRQAVLAEQKVGSQVTLLRKALRSYLIGTYGARSAIVAAFGFAPKVTTVSVSTKAGAIEKSAATRAAGGRKAIRKQQEAGTPVSAPVTSPVVSAAKRPRAQARSDLLSRL